MKFVIEHLSKNFQISRIFAEGFYEWIRFFSKDKQDPHINRVILK